MHVSYNMLDAHLNERISRLGRKEEKKKRGSAVVVNWRVNAKSGGSLPHNWETKRVQPRSWESWIFSAASPLSLYPFLRLHGGCERDDKARVYVRDSLSVPGPSLHTAPLTRHGCIVPRDLSPRVPTLHRVYHIVFLRLEFVTTRARYLLRVFLRCSNEKLGWMLQWKGMHHQGVIFEKGKESWYKNDEKVERDY